MNNLPEEKVQKTPIIMAILAIIILGGAGYGGYRYNLLSKESASTQQSLEAKINGLEALLAKTEKEKGIFEDAFKAKDEEVVKLGGQVEKITGTVETLEKLNNTDEELLQKYSKVYFLNEHYLPSELRVIDKDLLFQPEKVSRIHKEVNEHLEDLMKDAEDDDNPLLVVSAYRSFGEQATLKTNYNFTYGAGTANQFSAEQGYSEHQLGTAVDFTTPTLGANFSSFEISPAYTWLQKNAYKYGFILSYPKENTYYQFEPWHWRFVGVDLARELHRQKRDFYDVEQRDIDEFLINIFD